MKTIYELRVDGGDCYYTCGFTLDQTEAEMALNAWKRWWDRLEKLSMLDEPPEGIEEQRGLLYDAIVNACVNPILCEEWVIEDQFGEHGYPKFTIIEHKVGINWGIADLAGKMPKLEGAKDDNN